MSKFGSLIDQAKKGSSSLENKTPMAAEEDRIEQKSVFENSGKTENQKAGKILSAPHIPAKGREVNLSIKVPENLRRHWVAEAKRQGTSITAEITLALNKKFGTPDK